MDVYRRADRSSDLINQEAEFPESVDSLSS